jgi:hypothetical protein
LSQILLFLPEFVHVHDGSCFSGVPVSSRVSAKIQQLVNTLKRPKRPPLREFFVDDFEELLEGKYFFFLPLLL